MGVIKSGSTKGATAVMDGHLKGNTGEHMEMETGLETVRTTMVKWNKERSWSSERRRDNING